MNIYYIKIMPSMKRVRHFVVIVTIIILIIVLFITIDDGDNSVNSAFSSNEDNRLSLTSLARKIERISVSLTDLWCNTKHIGYTGAFCLSDKSIFQGGNHVWDLKLCRSLEKLVGNKSIADFGAGLGPYGRCLLRHKKKVFYLTDEEKSNNINEMFLTQMGSYINTSKVVYSWDGFDGAGNVEWLSQGFVKQRDMTEEELWLGRKWDWIMSLEVGEHIPKNFETFFINNLISHGCQGIIISWALPGQGGHKHVNEQNTSYIKAQFTSRGLINDKNAEQTLRDSADYSYFRKTLMVFRYPSPKICTN